MLGVRWSKDSVVYVLVRFVMAALGAGLGTEQEHIPPTDAMPSTLDELIRIAQRPAASVWGTPAETQVVPPTIAAAAATQEPTAMNVVKNVNVPTRCQIDSLVTLS